MSDTSFFGHPRGLATLFFTEMWERFSYYGMRALLALYLTAQIIDGGMGMDAARGSAIVALYTFGVYLLSLPGGWIADRLLGQRKSVLYGGMIIAAGHFALAVPVDASFFFGLILLVVGTGLLKPNVSAIVGDLYEGKGAQRDAGFSIFYMGINIGAFAGPLVCGALGENVDWHLGFGIAGVGMTLGLIQYVMGGKYLRDAGNLKISDDPAQRSRDWKYFFGTAFFCGVIGLAIWMLARNGTIQFTITEFATNTGYICLGLVSLYFAYLIFFAAKNSEERGRIGVIIALFIGAAVFWSGFEQASTGLTYFARDLTDRNIGSLVLPITWLQAINPLFIIILAPVIGGLWIKLDKKNPSFGVKFAMGLVLLGVGFLVLAWG
ncbi:MAG: oligopeptide:H+ symporter, partial [Acidobacteriota bacterium]|nr:oligopeptide:H+ symporter [Acidobacteriota bacterium]